MSTGSGATTSGPRGIRPPRRLAVGPGLRLLVPALLLCSVAILAVAIVALAAEPSAAPGGLVQGGDPRSAGAGPGIVGAPLLILLGVVLLGLATALVTAVLARFARRS